MKIKLNTEDDVYLDFNNSDELKNNIEEGNYSLSEQEDKEYSFSIAKNGDYNFETIVLANGEDYDSSPLATKTIEVKVDELTNTGEVDNDYDAVLIDNALTINFGDHSGVDLAYYYWCDGESNTTQLHEISDSQTSVTIESCLDSNNVPRGYLLFVVKPKDGYVFTGVNASGSGQIWIIKDNGDINANDYLDGTQGVGNYDGVTTLIKNARDKGYTTCFGWSKFSSGMPDHKLSFTTTAAEPSMQINVTAKENNNNLLPGQRAHLTISIKPTLEKTGVNITNTTKTVKITHVNGVKLTTPYELHDDDRDGTYTCDADYTITDQDFKNGKVTFSGTGEVTYESKLTATSGDVTRTNTVSGTGTAQINPFNYFDKNKALITYEFKASTDSSIQTLPDAVTAKLPTFNVSIDSKNEKVHYTTVNVTDDGSYTPVEIKDKRVKVDDNHYWIFQGWEPSSKKFSEMAKSKAGTYSQTFTGIWKYLNTSIDIEVKDLDASSKSVTKVYDGKALTPTVTVKSADTSVANNNTFKVTYSTDAGNSWTNTVPSITDVGSKEFKVKVEATNYETKEFGPYTLKVTPASVTVTAKNASKTFGENNPSTYEVDITGLVNGESKEKIKYIVSRVTGEDAGAYTITPTGDATQGNYTVTYQNATFTITKSDEMNLIVDLNEASRSKKYDGKPLQAVVSANQDSTKIEYSTDSGNSWSEVVPSITDVGTLKVIARSVNNNFNEKKVEYYLTVTKRYVSFTGESASLLISDKKTVRLTGVIVGEDGLASGHSHNVVALASGSDVGTYGGSITAKGDVVIKDADGNDVTSNYDISTIAGSLKLDWKKANTCEEVIGKDWTWSEAKKACVYRVSKTATK